MATRGLPAPPPVRVLAEAERPKIRLHSSEESALLSHKTNTSDQSSVFSSARLSPVGVTSPGGREDHSGMVLLQLAILLGKPSWEKFQFGSNTVFAVRS